MTEEVLLTFEHLDSSFSKSKFSFIFGREKMGDIAMTRACRYINEKW